MDNPDRDDRKTLPYWMLKALGKPEKAVGRVLVLLEDPEDQQKVEKLIEEALRAAGVRFEVTGSF